MEGVSRLGKSSRKTLPKSIRFEVFKRDSFRCQYCGRSAPDVILECDHIIPVASGGTNDPLNLVTSCRDCNRGKGKKELSDLTAIAIQREQMDAMNEMREQTEMLIEWKKELMSLLDRELGAIDDYLLAISEWKTSAAGKMDLRRLIGRFGFEEVYISLQISFDRYFTGSETSWDHAFSKVGGVCYNRRRAREEDGQCQTES